MAMANLAARSMKYTLRPQIFCLRMLLLVPLLVAAVTPAQAELIVGALADAQGNRVAAAKALGLHRTHLMKLLKALRIT